MFRAWRVSLLLACACAVAGCHEEHAAPRAAQLTAAKAPTSAEAPPAPAPPAPAPPPPPMPARVERIPVEGDLPASVVRAPGGQPPLTVFLPGVCSNANAYVQTFPEAAQSQGGILAIEGDQPCGSGDYHTFSWDAAKAHARIEKALVAAGVTEIPREGLTIVGYSQGASLAEQMAARWPGRYSRVVLIGSPQDPAAGSFAKTRGVVTMSCDFDVPARMRTAASAMKRAGTPATYFEMPRCRHGNITEGERVFGATFDWLRANAKPVAESAAAIPVRG